MRCVQCLLLFCLVSAGLCSPRHEGDQTRRVKRSDDVSFAALQTLVQQQASMMDRLQADLTAYKNEVDTYRNQVVFLSSQLQTMQNKTDTELEAMQHKVDAASKSVAFTARISGSRDNIDNGMALGYHQTVVFDDVVTNIGSGYNQNDGIFIAHVSGTYVFFLQQMAPDKHSELFLAIVKNGAVLDIVYAQGSGDTADQGTSQVTTHLTAGDHVWVRQNSGDAVRASYWTVFTGFLLHAD